MQKWYQTVDDYALALAKANFYGPASTLSIRQYAVRAGLSNPATGVVLIGANLLALGALVAVDPAGLRGTDPGSPWIEIDPVTMGRDSTVSTGMGSSPALWRWWEDDDENKA